MSQPILRVEVPKPNPDRQGGEAVGPPAILQHSGTPEPIVRSYSCAIDRPAGAVTLT
jgi:hypothetical protein